MRAVNTNDLTPGSRRGHGAIPLSNPKVFDLLAQEKLSMTNVREPEPMLIRETDDIVIARHVGRCLGKSLGCSDSKIALLTTAISELARNIILYAEKGEISVSEIRVGPSNAILIIANDNGPGIADVNCALTGGYSTSGGLGLGLSGLHQIADRFEIESRYGEGTCVKVIILAG